MFYITPANINLQRITPNVGTVTLGRTETLLAMNEKKKMRLEFRANKPENFLEVLVDGKSMGQWKDSSGWAGKGSGVLFFAQNENPIRISNIKVSEWDGVTGAESTANAAATNDTLHLANRDKVSGKVINLRDGKLKFDSTPTALEIPLTRIKQIHFGSTNTNAIPHAPWEIQASVAGGGTVSFELEKWTNDKILGENASFGRISLNSKSIRQIQFNLGQSKDKFSGAKSADEAIWEVDEQ
jgi:hypothetical protein